MDDPRQSARNIDDLLAKVVEIKELLSLPAGMTGRTDQICALAGNIAHNAPHGGIADLARKVGSEARESDSRRIGTYLSHLKAELEEARKISPNGAPVVTLPGKKSLPPVFDPDEAEEKMLNTVADHMRDERLAKKKPR